MAAAEVLENLGATVVSIPALSPDLNPIENFFDLIGKAIKEDTIKKNITNETFHEFSERVRKSIQSMDKRVGMTIAAKGNRIKY